MIKLKEMHASLSQTIGRQGVAWTRTGADGEETVVNVWQQPKNEQERRDQRLYLAFQNRLRQQGRLDGSAIELDLDNEYDVQTFFEQSKIKLKKRYDYLERLSKVLLWVAMICLATRTARTLRMFFGEALEFACC